MPTNALCTQRVAELERLMKPLNKEVGRAYAGLHADVLNPDTGKGLRPRGAGQDVHASEQ
jgi:hypothetical protein